MCLIWLTRYPQHIAAQELRRLVLLISKIETENDRAYWVQEFRLWYSWHQEYINEKSFNEDTGRYWYRHRMLRRSYSVINSALPNMFHYLSNKEIPKTNNGIEGFFSHLKNHLNIHRGLTTKHRINFIKWYIYFSNEKWVFLAIGQTNNENRANFLACPIIVV